MEAIPGNDHRYDGRLVRWAKYLVCWTLRGLEIFVSAIGALVMLVVIGFFALWDFAFG